MNSASLPPLFMDLSGGGGFELDGAMTYLSQTLGTDYEERFTTEAGRVLRETCQRVADEIAESGTPFDRPNEGASLRFTQPVYRVDVSVAKTRARRSSAGLWFVFYTLEDRAGVKRADTLFVVALRHNTSRPFSVEGDEAA